MNTTTDTTRTDAVDKSVIRRIKKLLAHTERENANSNEAAIAAAEAARLMARYRIDRALVEAATGDRQSEPIDVEVVFTLPTKSIPSWLVALVRAITDVNNCNYFWDWYRVVEMRKHLRVVKVVGRATDRQAVKLLLEFVAHEVDRLADAALADRTCGCGARAVNRYGYCPDCDTRREAPRTFANNYRLGVVDTVRTRLREMAKKGAAGVVDEIGEEVGDKPDAAVVSRALVLIRRDREEVDVYYRDVAKKLGLRSLAQSAYRVSHGGREAGREAGKHIHLGARLDQAEGAPHALGGR